MTLLLALLLALVLVFGSSTALSPPPPRETARKPNFIVILVDDLDVTQGSSDELAMPATKRWLRDRGVTFSHHFVTTPICCPSRVNLLRGQLSHNTNFTDVLGPHGGYAKFRALGLDREWLPTWLQRAGYNTLYTGKFIVDYTIANHDPPPSGWTSFDALVHPFTFEYYCPAFSLNGGKPRMYPAQYSTDVVGSKAVAMLRSAAADPAGRPFYLQVAPPAPHHSMHYEFNSSGAFVRRHWYPPVPASRHWEELSGAQLPRPPSFNDPWVGGKPAWLAALARLTPPNVTFLGEVHRLRLRAMRAVDELVEAIASEVAALGLTEHTYIAFTSDNGYHEGAHRMGSGKTTAYEEDIRVPLIVAGPGLTPGSQLDDVTAHIDIAPTVLALAGLPLPASLDGVPLPLAAVSDGGLPDNYLYGKPDQGPLRNQLVAEFWGEWVEESIHSHPAYPNLTWKAVRVLRADRQEAYKYVLHCSGEFELYDLVRDPYERVNLLAPVDAAAAGVAGAGWPRGPGRWWSAARAAVSQALRGGADEAPTGAAEAVGEPTAAETAGSATSGAAASGVGAAAGVVSVAGARAAAAARAWAKTAWATLGKTAAVTRGSTSPARDSAGGVADVAGSEEPDSDDSAGGGEDDSGGGASSDSKGGSEGASRRRRRRRSMATAAAAARDVSAGMTRGSLPSDYARWLLRIRGRLDALLAVLAVCRGRACSHPFQVLHPEGGVSDLWAAMDEQYDKVYDSIQPFSFGQCLPYQDLDNERSAFRGAVVAAAPTCSEPDPDTGTSGGGGGGGQGAAACAGAAGAAAVVESTEFGDGGDSFRLIESEYESAAVPLPTKYQLVTDLYGSSAAQDAMLLA